jgi:hypothetical protein
MPNNFNGSNSNGVASKTGAPVFGGGKISPAGNQGGSTSLPGMKGPSGGDAQGIQPLVTVNVPMAGGSGIKEVGPVKSTHIKK